MPEVASTEVIEAAGRMESSAERLYAVLAAHDPYEPFLRLLFERLAVEEAQHARILLGLLRTEARSLWTVEVAARLVERLDAMSAEIESVEAELLRESDALRPTRIVQRLAEMEARFHRLHVDELAESTDPEANRIFRMLAAQDGAHRDLLLGARMRFGA